MNLIKIDDDKITLESSSREILMFIRALNEVCNGDHFEYYEFHTRMGFYKEEVEVLLDQFLKSVGGPGGRDLQGE